MVRYQIPKIFLPGFNALAQMGSTEVAQMARLLEELPVGTSIDVFKKSIRDHGLSEKALLSANTIYSLPGLLTGEEDEKAQLAKDLSDAFEQQSEEKIAGGLKEQLQQHLHTILTSSGNLQKTFKAVRLLHENVHSYQKSSVVTDVRFIFDEDFGNPIKSGLIIHQLKLQYLQNNEDKEFYISMDRSDLMKLKANLNRALDKESAIKKENNKVNFINFT